MVVRATSRRKTTGRQVRESRLDGLKSESLPNERRMVRHRAIAIVASILTTVAIFVGYVVGDVVDVFPGLLTLRPVAVRTFEKPKQVRDGASLVGPVDASRAVDPQAADRLVRELIGTEGVGSNVSVIIEDAQGTVAAEHESGTPREPASTMKTLTALAAASTLDMADTLDTQVFLEQTGNANIVNIKGNGDMLLSAGESDPDHTNGRAGLATLAGQTAAALAQRGIDSVKLTYDDTLFGEERTPETMPGDYTMYYTPISSMAVDGGRQYSAAQPRPADPDDSPGYPELSQHTALDAVTLFKALLEARGITVEGNPVAQSAPDGLSPLTSVSSATLGEILAYTLRHSDNTLAEEFGRLTALAAGKSNSPADATLAVRSAIDRLGINTDGLSMADCSGLAPGSTLTVRTLAAVQRMNLVAGEGAAAAEGLSVAGLTGTARNRYDDDAVAGLLRMKTGSLSEVTSMTGNVSRIDGGVLSFAVIVNTPDNMDDARSAIDSFVTKLAGL